MTIGYVLKTFPRLSQTFVINELMAHQRAALPMHIFSLRRPKAEDYAADVSALTAPVHYLGESVPRSDGDGTQRPSIEELADELAGSIQRLGITHLHAHFGNSAAEVARLAARRAGVGYTFTAHARDIFHESVDNAALAMRLAQANGVVTVSDFNLRHLDTTYGLEPGHVTRIYNGLDLQHFPFVDTTGRDRIIFAVGRLIEKKGFADLLVACAHLRDKGVDFRCVIAGSGPLAGDLAAQVQHLRLSPCVELLGAIAPGDVTRWMQRAAVLAAPCVIGSDGDRDGLPTVLLEAMALGCPCVSTDVTGIPEILHDGQTGLLVPQHHPRALATALARVLDDASLAAQLAQQARRLIEESFDIHRNTARQRRLFAAAAAAAAAATESRALAFETERQ